MSRESKVQKRLFLGPQVHQNPIQRPRTVIGSPADEGVRA